MPAGFRGLLELLLWRAATPAPEPTPAASTERAELRIRAYHGEAAEYIEDWAEYGTVEVTFSAYGPDVARIDVPRTAPFLHHTRSLPGGVGVFLEIDGRDFGVPDVWLGRMLAPQFDGDGAAVALSLKGPEEWLSRIGTPLSGATSAPSAAVVASAIQASRVQTHLVMDAASGSRWSRVPVDLSGESLWALMTALAEQRGEEFWLAPRSGRVLCDVAWRHPLDSPDRSGEVTLEHGENCTLSSSALAVGMPLSEAVGIASSYAEGAEVAAALVKAPPAARLGLRDALTAALSSLTVRRLAGVGTSQAIPAPEITSQAALEAMLEATLRREMVATCAVQVADIDMDLWPHLRPGTLLGAMFPDPFGLFEDAVVRVRTATFALAPTLSASISGELWAIGAAHA